VPIIGNSFSVNTTTGQLICQIGPEGEGITRVFERGAWLALVAKEEDREVA